MRHFPFALMVAVSAATGVRVWSQPSLQQLYDDQHWFELRDALRDHEAPPALYRAAVASAFNRTEEAARATNQQVTSSRRASFDCAAGADGGIRMPLSVNGREVNWALDTGFNLPGLSEAEALMLGIVVPEATGEAIDGAGGSTSIRVAVADRVTIGGTELRHVLMGVFPDSQSVVSTRCFDPPTFFLRRWATHDRMEISAWTY